MFNKILNRVNMIEPNLKPPVDPTLEDGGGGTNPEPGTPGNPDPNKSLTGDKSVVSQPSKFEGKTSEQLIDMLRESDSTIQNLSTQASKVEELEYVVHQLLSGVKGAAGTEPGVPAAEQPLFSEEEAMELFKDPNTAVNKIAKRIIETAQSGLTKTMEDRKSSEEHDAALKNHFYETVAPELKGYEILVGAIAGTVQAQYPNVPPHKLMKTIAETTKQEIKRMGITLQTTSDPNPLLPGGGNRVQQQTELTGDKKEIADLINSRR